MTQELQDRAWVSLPPEYRKEVRALYQTALTEPIFNAHEDVNLFEHLFGKHNIVSVIEPEEMLMVEKSKVAGLYKRALSDDYITISSGAKLQLSRGIRFALRKLFSDKCLPDKDLEQRLEQTSVQVEPKYKFSLGQEVILHFHGGEKATISERLPPQDGIVWNCYKVKGLPHHIWRENELDPYVEKPLTYDVGQRVRVINVTNLAILHKIGTIEELPNNSHYDMYKVRFANGYSHLEASKLEPYTEE